MRSEARTRAFQIIAGVILTACLCASGCRNPVTIETVAASPSGGWVAELISHDVSWLTGTKGDFAILVLVRKPQDKRDTTSQMVVEGVGKTIPSLQWVSEQALDVLVPRSVEVTTQRNVAGVTVNVRKPTGP